MFNYAQLDEQNVCVGITVLNSIVPRVNEIKTVVYNLETGEEESTVTSQSIMVRIPVYTEQYLGMKYLNQGKWGKEEDEILEYDETLEFGYIAPLEVPNETTTSNP